MKTSAPESLRRNVKHRLKARGDRAKLARALGVAESTISTWLAGRNDIELSRLDDIAAFFGVTVGELFSLDDLPRQTSTGVSASEGNSGGSHDADTAGLVELARQAALFEGKKEALGLIADAIADEIERLDRESRTAHSNAARPHLARRKSR